MMEQAITVGSLAGSSGELRDRMGRIDRYFHQGALSLLADEVRQLTMAARARHLEGVALLAHGLEAEIAASGHAAMVNAYIERMEDAILMGDANPVAMEAMFATIRARMVM